MSDLYRYYESGKLDERERIIKLLEQLRREWQEKLSWYLQQQNQHEVVRYRNYILALDDLRDMAADPDSFKGEQK